MHAVYVWVQEGGRDGGFKPMHYACRSGHVEMVSLLIEHGADLDLLDEEGTPEGSIAYIKHIRSAHSLNTIIIMTSC